MPAVLRGNGGSEFTTEEEQEADNSRIAWSGLSRTVPVLLFLPEAVVSKDGRICSVGERYNLAFKIVHAESHLIRGLLINHGFCEVHQNSEEFNLMWTGAPFNTATLLLRSLQDFQKVNHFPRSSELTRKDRLYKNIQKMQETYGLENFHIVPQTFVLPSEYQQFCNCSAKDKGPWIVKPVASSSGQGIYLVSHPKQIIKTQNMLVSRYITNPLLIDEFKFDMRLYVLVTSYDPLLVYVYEEGLARFATVKYEHPSKNISNTFMHLTNYSVNKKNSDYVSCSDPEVEDYGSKWSMSALLRYLKQEGKDTCLLMRQIEDVIVKAFLSAQVQIASACKAFVPHKTNCFELYGFDVLIDSNLKPWLLEVNHSPSLSCDTPLDLKIKASMIADMFSLIGVVCRNPQSRQLTRAQRAQRQQLTSVNNSDKQESKQSQKYSTLSLTAEEIKALRRIDEEYERRGGFVRIFPTADTLEIYGGYLEPKTSLNFMLARRLFHGRYVYGNVVNTGHHCNGAQYERKLLSLDGRRRARHLNHGRHAAKKNSVKESKAPPPEDGREEAEESAEEGEWLPGPASHQALVSAQRKQAATPVERCHGDAQPGSQAAAVRTRREVDLLNILQQGWNLSTVQARLAFSSYLHQVQQRMLAESRADTVSAWPDKDNNQMELVIRFLRRASSNLQQYLHVVLPSRQLPLKDRRRILSDLLRDFIRCYNKDTKLMASDQGSCEEPHCVNRRVFQEFITAATENDLEEVLTFYTQKNNSATVFLGTKVHIKHSRDSDILEDTKYRRVAQQLDSAPESSLRSGDFSSSRDLRVSARQPLVHMLSKDLWADVRAAQTRPALQASQHCSSFPLTLDCTQLSSQHCAPASSSLLLRCPPPPAPSQPPQPPSYAQSLAKSHFSHFETLCDPPAYPSAPVTAQPPRATPCDSTRLATVLSTQVPHRPQCFTSSMTSPATSSSLPSVQLIDFKELCRPTSVATSKGSSSRLKSSSVDALRELNMVRVEDQESEQVFISAPQKLADKQAARQHLRASRSKRTTPHLTQPEADPFQRPLRAMESSAEQPSSSSHRTLQEEEGGHWEGPTQTAYSLVTGAKPKHHHHHQPAQGNYLLGLGVQQRLESHQCLDQSHSKHQAHIPDQLQVEGPTKSSSYPPSGFQVQSSTSHICTDLCPVPTPEPPSSSRKEPAKKMEEVLEELRGVQEPAGGLHGYLW